MDVNKLISSIITLLVGIAVFIVGMNLMSSGLKKSTGKGVRTLFKKTQNNPVAGMGIGVATTALVQSSSTTSIMVIGFVATGIMTIYQGVSVILGGYIGTTVTGLIASLSSFPISKYFVLLAVAGVIMMFFKKEKIKNIGEIVTGLGLLFFGLSTMSSSVKADTAPEMYEIVTNVFNATNFPLLLFLIGIVFTSLVQSSSATAGIAIVMVGSGAINLESGFYLMLGAGIGTVIPMLLASIGGNVNVKRTTAICVFIRIVTCTLCTLLIWPFKNGDGNYISDFFYYVFKNNELALAMFVLAYNLIFMLGFLPLIKPLEKLFTKLIKDKEEEKRKQELKFINDNLLKSPSLALYQTKREIERMSHLAQKNLNIGFEMLMTLDMSQKDELNNREDKIDYINNAITQYLIKLSPNVTSSDEKVIGGYFHVINDIERIGDHAANFKDMAQKMSDNDLAFSEVAHEEFRKMYGLIQQMFDISLKVFEDHNDFDIKQLHDLEAQTDKLKEELSTAHFNRLKDNKCNVELSPFYSQLVTELERIGDHLTNVGYSFVNPTGDDPLDK
ncbi:MAG: Na/Pi cotransporter family protein [Bacilli bacterium]|nr:Na/Pi cotransporter family protein [Bacilli bacterium]